MRRWRRSALPKAPWYGTQPIPVFARCRLSGPLCLLLGCCCCRPLSGWPLLTTRGRISRPADGRGIGGDSATVAVGPNCRSCRCWCQPLTYTRRYAVRRSGDWRRVGRDGPAGLRSAGIPGLRAATIHTTTGVCRTQGIVPYFDQLNPPSLFKERRCQNANPEALQPQPTTARRRARAPRPAPTSKQSELWSVAYHTFV